MTSNNIVDDSRVLKNLLEKQMIKQMDDHPIQITPVQITVLNYLDQHPDQEVLQKDLTKVLDVSKPNVNGIIKRLVEKGFVKIEPSAQNWRAKKISLTDKVLMHEQDYLSDMKQVNKIAFAGLNQEEIALFRKTMTTVIKNLEKSLQD